MAGRSAGCRTSLFSLKGYPNQVENVVELKISLAARAGEQRHVIAVPSIVAESSKCGSLNASQNIAPVIAVLDEITQGETIAKTRCQAL